MQKGQISNKYATFRNRGNGNDTGVYWVKKRLGIIRSAIVIGGFIVFGIYLFFWWGKYNHKLKNPCTKAYELPLAGEVIKAYLEKNSKGVVTVLLLQQNDTVEYYTGWGGHTNTGQHIRKGCYLKKQANSFDLMVAETKNAREVIELKATIKVCNN
jgi:hypothetical protein